MVKRKTKKYYEEEAKKARRSAHTSREKHKAWKKGFKSGQRNRIGDEL